MENKDSNTDYQNVVTVGKQKWEIAEITIRIIFFCLFVCFFKIHIHYFLTASFKVPPEKKSAQPEVPITTQILIWPKSLFFFL